jgi:hypothetical protein
MANVSEIFWSIYRNKIRFIAFFFVGFLGAFAIFASRPPVYTSNLLIAPAPNNLKDRFGGAGEVSGLSELVGLNSGTQGSVSPFGLLLQRLYSRGTAGQLLADDDFARVVFAGEWDDTAHEWRLPDSWTNKIIAFVRRTLGSPPYVKPSAERLQAYIDDNVKTKQLGKLPIYQISYSSKDPLFSERFLQTLFEITDGMIRAEERVRAENNSKALEREIARTTVMATQAALSSVLLEEKRRAILAEVSVPYSATIVDAANVPDQPSSPRPLTVLVGATVFGIFIGVGGVLISKRRGWRNIGVVAVEVE